jgi:hypothetical protein
VVPWRALLARAGDWKVVDDVRKLDTSNRQQLELMHRHFSHNMAAVDFWLNSRVLPQETQQYPQRLVASAWHLADNPSGCVVGFSGTNDNHRLLPLQVKQHLEVEDSLRATNGKMLAVMLANREYGTLLPQVCFLRTVSSCIMPTDRVCELALARIWPRPAGISPLGICSASDASFLIDVAPP